MRVIETEIKGVFIIEPIVRGDSRGYFMESFLKDKFSSEVCNTEFVQENDPSQIEVWLGDCTISSRLHLNLNLYGL